MAPPHRVAGLVLAAVAGVLAGCSGPSEQEYDAALAAFDDLPAEVKAYVCADDFYAVQHAVEGFVIVERCRSGTGVPVARTEPLSPEFEAADQRYTAQYYAQNPPEARQLREVDTDRLCSLDEQALRADISAWRARTTFPSWEGVEYVPSEDHEVARLLLWRQVACPLLEG